MRTLVWKLPQLLKENNIKPKDIRKNALGLSPNIPYQWVILEKPPERIHTEALETFTDALERILKRPVALTELLDWEETTE